MTRISRSIHIDADAKTTWSYMDLSKWSSISTIFAEIKLLSEDSAVEGARAEITAGPGEEKIQYTAKIVTAEPEKRLAYDREGGPLPGRSEWALVPNGKGVDIRYENTFEHQLDEPVRHSMTNAMDNFLTDLKGAIEAGSTRS